MAARGRARNDMTTPEGGAQLPVEELRTEAMRFLEASATRKTGLDQPGWGEGSDRISLFEERDPEQDLIELSRSRQWRQQVFDAGFGWITGPIAYGGRGLGPEHQRAWQSAEAEFDTPPQTVFGIGLGMVAPTILAHAREEIRQRYLSPMHRGDILGCQLFSEPAAGSDLAGVTTRAERDGDAWVLNGQKVWTSFAHLADIGEILCRSDPAAPKHRGLTAFLLDMHASGVEVRPLRQMTGEASFNEVFLTDVRVPDDHRLGAVHEGWSVALTTLMNERAAIGGGSIGGGMSTTPRLVELARRLGRAEDPVIRQRLADLVIHSRVAGYTNRRAMAQVTAGQAPGPELSLAKLSMTGNLVRAAEAAAAILGPAITADTGVWGTYAWSEMLLGVPGGRIAGGTDEVLKNVVGERVLGLPKEPKPI